MIKIYLAGPLSGTTEGYLTNAHNMIAMDLKLRKLGFAVFDPSLDIILGLISGGMTYEDYIGNNLPFITSCDAIFLCPGWKESKGCNREANIAVKHRMPVFTDIAHLCEYFHVIATKKTATGKPGPLLPHSSEVKP